MTTTNTTTFEDASAAVESAYENACYQYEMAAEYADTTERDQMMSAAKKDRDKLYQALRVLVGDWATIEIAGFRSRRAMRRVHGD